MEGSVERGAVHTLKHRGRFTLAGEERLGDPPLLQAWSIHIQTDTHLKSFALFQHVGCFLNHINISSWLRESVA